MFLTGLTIGLILYVVWMSKDAGFRVEEGQVAVVKAFGAAKHDDGRLRVWPPGFHWKWPWEEVAIVSLREQALELSGEHGGQTVMADDGTLLRVDSTLRYEPLREGLSRFLFATRAPVEHLTGLLTCILRNEVANLRPSVGEAREDDLGAYALLRQGRRLLNQRINEFGREILAQRYGIRFVAFDLVDIHPPDELADSLNAVIHARIEAQAMFARAVSESQKYLLAAREGVAIAKTKASAVEIEIRELGRHLSTLEEQGMLEHYVARRLDEVLSESKTVYLKDTAEVAR
jgi:regulator of protease activity HflC (stomatin/prohibitin superfamily)